MNINSNLTFKERAIAVQHLIKKASDMGLSIEDFRDLELKEKLSVLSEVGQGAERLSKALTNALIYKNKITSQGKEVEDFIESLKNYKSYIDEVFNKCLESNI